MSELLHFQLMSKYNSRMNEQVYEAALLLDTAVRDKNLGAYFQSISGTLNHILVGDLLWFSRFTDHCDRYKALIELSAVAKPKSLNDMLFSDFEQLYVIRRKVDTLIDQWARLELEQEDLGKALTYKNAKGVRGHKPFRELLHHAFNHQTHHRGQVSTLLYQCGVDVGVTDFLMDVPDYS